MLLARHVFALFIVTLLVVNPIGAFADPPDPTWISGYWYDDDFDNAVIAIAGTSAVEAPSSTDGGAPLWRLVWCVDPQTKECPPAPAFTAVSPRAPPVDSPTHS